MAGDDRTDRIVLARREIENLVEFRKENRGVIRCRRVRACVVVENHQVIDHDPTGGAGYHQQQAGRDRSRAFVHRESAPFIPAKSISATLGGPDRDSQVTAAGSDGRSPRGTGAALDSAGVARLTITAAIVAATAIQANGASDWTGKGGNAAAARAECCSLSDASRQYSGDSGSRENRCQSLIRGPRSPARGAPRAT